MVHDITLSQTKTPKKSWPVNVTNIAIDPHFSSANHEADKFIEEIVGWVESEFLADQIIKAKEDFYWKTGKVFTYDDCFNTRMSYFIDYFVFERVLETDHKKFSSKTPIEAHYLAGNCRIINTFRHAIFKILKVTQDNLTVRDLVRKDKILISARKDESFTGIEKGSLFQGFVYFLQKENILSKGIFFHPSSCSRFLTKTYRKSLKIEPLYESKFLSNAAKSNLKAGRHPKIHSLKIYQELITD